MIVFSQMYTRKLLVLYGQEINCMIELKNLIQTC